MIKIIAPAGASKVSQRIMSDEKSAWLREQYIAQGLIVPTKTTFHPGDRPELGVDAVERYKQLLIKRGIITPGRPPEASIHRPRDILIRPLNH